MFKKSILILLCFFSFLIQAQIKVASWNIQNFGKSKSVEAFAEMVAVLKDYDVVAIQEVVAKNGGAQAVAQLADELNRKGSKWDYVISNPTAGKPFQSERYAFLWKTSILKIVGKPWLDQNYSQQIEREPFFCTFQHNNKQFTLVSFHAVPKNKMPENEIKYFKFIPQLYPNLNLIFMGDFNCPQSNVAFTPLKKLGFQPAFVKQKTSLKMKCKGNVCLASEYDNIFFNPKKIKLMHAEVVHFYKKFPNLVAARKVSDHIPVTMEFDIMP